MSKLHFKDLTQITCPFGMLDDDTQGRFEDYAILGDVEVFLNGVWQDDPYETRGLGYTYRAKPHVKYVRADRIEELEAKLARYDDLVADKINLRSENAALKAKLAKALDFIQDMTGCEWPYDENAKRILAKLTGGNDE